MISETFESDLSRIYSQYNKSNKKRFHNGWMFLRGDPAGAELNDYDDRAWEIVTVPHDWAIAGPFGKDFDKQVLPVAKGGRIKTMFGRTGGLPHPGVGWYRKKFEVASKEAGHTFYIEFDGVMSYSTIYINGRKVGGWPYGYTSFHFDITDLIRPGQENVLAVRVENLPCASRWYPGAGIYRNVWLRSVLPTHVAPWGVWVTSPQVTALEAQVAVTTQIVNHAEGNYALELETLILDDSGQVVAQQKNSIPNEKEYCAKAVLKIPEPIFWNIDHPYLYYVISKIIVDGKSDLGEETPFGIRTLTFDANRGLELNGQSLRLKGVCLHHDLGPLGAAFSIPAVERQLSIMKEMGCNAVRTSHNPAAPEFLDLCDRMGLLVIEEAFDAWREKKVDNDYHWLFDNWAEKDLSAMIRRDRNHPCIIMWSIGNEVGEQSNSDGADVARFLTDICHRYDSTRPTTAGFSMADEAISNGLAEAVDVPGWNYQPSNYARFHSEHPDWLMYGSETASCLSSRGEYFLPPVSQNVVEGVKPWRDRFHCSSYDLEYNGYPPDIEFAAQEDYSFIFGEFVWTGFDYIGEATPYRENWPSRSSYYGIVDLAGIPKDRFYLYQSQWRLDLKVLHLLPHWNWAGWEGKPIPVYCYTSFDEAELFLNGRSLGLRQKNKSGLDRFRLRWENVLYEPGVLKAVVRSPDGQIIAETEIKTAGLPYAIDLSVNRDHFLADGEDLVFVTASIKDKDGILCPKACDRVHFRIEGPGEVIATCNGDQTCLEPFGLNHKKAFNGFCVAIIRSKISDEGKIIVRGEAEGLTSGVISLFSH